MHHQGVVERTVLFALAWMQGWRGSVRDVLLGVLQQTLGHLPSPRGVPLRAG